MAFKDYNPPILERPFTIPSRDWESLAPAWTDVWAASVRQDNSLGSLLGYGLSIAPEPRGRYNPDFNKWDVIPREFYDHADAYWWAQSPEDVEYISSRLEKQLKDKQTLDRAGFSALLPSLINGTLDPINLPFMLIPAAQAARSGWGLLRSTGRVALEGGFGAGLSELALRQTQESRTGMEALLNISGATLLSGILGGAAGSVGLGFRKLADSVEADIRTRPRQLTGQTITGGFGTGKTVQQALAEARSEGWISDGEYRLARYVFDLDSTIDENTTLEIVDAVREATDKELSGYGVDFGEGKPAILGETHTENAKTAIRLYAGHDADTVVEEFYHRFYDRLSPEEKAVFQKYYDELADPRPVNEVFAQQGRDFFFSEKLHEKAGTLREIFRKAKSTLIALIGRIREIRGARIPEKIQDLYRRAGEPYKEPELSVSKVEEPLKVQPEAKAEAEPVTQTQAITETVAQAEKPTVKTFIKLPENPVKQAREYVNIRLREAAQKARDAGVYDEIVQRMNTGEPLEKIAKDIKKRLDIGIYDVRKMIHGIQAVERVAGGETGFQIRAPESPGKPSISPPEKPDALEIEADGYRYKIDINSMGGVEIIQSKGGSSKLLHSWDPMPVSVREMEKSFREGVYKEYIQKKSEYNQALKQQEELQKEIDELAKTERVERLRKEIREKGKPVYIRFGKPPKSGRSYNSMLDITLPGVSVYKGYLIDDNKLILSLHGIEPWSFINFFDRTNQDHPDKGVFVISGKVLKETGSDGEPLLKNIKIERELNIEKENIELLLEPESASEASASFQIRAPQTPEFKAWFGDSKVVDENGQPKVVYHGTAAPFFEEFSEGKDNKGFDSGLGFFFSENPKYASFFTNKDIAEFDDLLEVEPSEQGRIIPVYIKVENPFKFDSLQAVMHFMDNPGYKLNGVESGYRDAKSLSVAIEDAGYDGILIDDNFGNTWITFYSEQIKSVFNQGTFDPSDSRISYQIRNLPELQQKRSAYRDTIPALRDAFHIYARKMLDIEQKIADAERFREPDMSDLIEPNERDFATEEALEKAYEEYDRLYNAELERREEAIEKWGREEARRLKGEAERTKKAAERIMSHLDPKSIIADVDARKKPIKPFPTIPELEPLAKAAFQAHRAAYDFVKEVDRALFKYKDINIQEYKQIVNENLRPLEELTGEYQSERYDLSYQIRQAVNSIADLPPGTDPNKVTRPPIIPEWAWKHVASFHPGLQPFVVKTLSTPAKMAEWMVETAEFLNKNWYGERTAEAVETVIKRERNAYNYRFNEAYKGGYTRLAKRLAEEREKSGDPQGIITRLLQRYSDKQKYNQDLYDALMELSEGKRALLQMDLSKRFPPEIVETAQEIGKIYNELGKRLEAQGLLPPTYKEVLEGGMVHVPRVWNQAAVMRYRGRLEQIFLDDWNERNTLPFTGGGEAPEIPDFNGTMDKIIHSPAGYLGVEIVEDADPTKAGKARFLEERSIDIDSRKLWFYETDADGNVVKDREGNPVKIWFVETDPQKIYNNYLSSTLPDIILAERNNGDITLKNFFEEINKEAREKLAEAKDDTTKALIIKERDLSIKNLKALRDQLRGDYAPGGVKRDPSSVWARMSNTVRAVNMMVFLGGVTISSLGDIVRPLFHWGFEYYATALMKYATMGRENRKAFKKHLRIYGVVGDFYLQSRLNAIADVGDNTINLTTAERWVRYWQDKMGLFTGIDWWDSQVKTIAGFVANHAILDIAQQLKKAGAVDMASASRVVRRHFIEDIARMGIGLDDLLKIADEIEAAGEDFDGLILPRMDKWQDKALSARYLTALTKEVDELIVIPGVGDKPLWAHYELAKVILQFKAYPMAAMRRIVFQGMQRPDNKLAISMMFSTLMGGFVYSIKQWERGEDVTDDPKQFLYESIDRAGLFGYLLDANNYIEQLSGNRLGLNPLIGLDQTSRNRFQTSLLDVLFGPTGSTLKYGQRAALAPLDAVFGDGLTEADINAMYKLIWYSKIFGIRNIMEALRESSIETFAVNRQNEPAFTPGD